MDRRFRRARVWSNQQLRLIAPLCEGKIANVSAGDDVDKEGSTYETYFPQAHSYVTTNYAPGAFRGFQGRENELLLDLTAEVPVELRGAFDVVFNHTTLEHIFPVREAFTRLCSLSQNLVIVVVPFCQEQHENDGYMDYWRFTPMCLREMFREEGYTVLYESANNQFNTAVYLFFVASRHPEQWEGKMPVKKPVTHAAEWVGSRAVFLQIPPYIVSFCRWCFRVFFRR